MNIGQTEMGEYFRNLWQAVTEWAIAASTVWTDLLIAAVIMLAAITIAVLFSRIIFRRVLRLFIWFGPILTSG